MVLIIEPSITRIVFTVFRRNDGTIVVRSTEDAVDSWFDGEAFANIRAMNGPRAGFRAIGVRVLQGKNYGHTMQKVNNDFLWLFDDDFSLIPSYTRMLRGIFQTLMENFADVPMFAFFDSAFFSAFENDRGASAVPRSVFRDANVSRRGSNGIMHNFNTSLFDHDKKVISVTMDTDTTVCPVRCGAPCAIDRGLTRLSGIMGATSCGDIDPGIVFYLMNEHRFSPYAIDEMLKNESGFFGITGSREDIPVLFERYGTDAAVTLAFDIYRTQLLKYIGEGAALMEGIDALVFSGKHIRGLAPFAGSLARAISFLGITLTNQPWEFENRVATITEKASKISILLHTYSIQEIMFESCLHEIGACRV